LRVWRRSMPPVPVMVLRMVGLAVVVVGRRHAGLLRPPPTHYTRQVGRGRLSAVAHPDRAAQNPSDEPPARPPHRMNPARRPVADVAGRPIDRRAFLVVATGLALGMLRPARSQAAGKPYRIGFLGNSTAALEANLVGP